jgi:hypothetical protein
MILWQVSRHQWQDQVQVHHHPDHQQFGMDRDNIRHKKRMCGILRGVDGYNPIPRASFERVRFRAIGALISEPVHRVVYHAVCGEGFDHTGNEHRYRPHWPLAGGKFPAPACSSHTFQGLCSPLWDERYFNGTTQSRTTDDICGRILPGHQHRMLKAG